jgi:DNA-directed RNA polymerase sigma subunit (sigma70/sigma32)
MTLHEIALELGISHQAVWQIQNNAINKLRKALSRHNITYEEFESCLKYS